jgi:hypothetical protein
MYEEEIWQLMAPLWLPTVEVLRHPRRRSVLEEENVTRTAGYCLSEGKMIHYS